MTPKILHGARIFHDLLVREGLRSLLGCSGCLS